MINEREELLTANNKVYPINKAPNKMLPKPPGFGAPQPNAPNNSKPPVYRAPYGRPQGAGGGAPRNANANYRSKSKRGRHICCQCCIWTFIFLLIVALIMVIGYYIFKPQQPSFSVTDLKVARLNITKDLRLASEVTVRLVARNPNKYIGFAYEKSDVTVTYQDSANDDVVVLGNGSFPAFLHSKKNTTVIKMDLKGKSSSLSETTGKDLKGSFAKKKLKLEMELKTHVRVVISKWKSGKIKITVVCSQLSTSVHKNVKCSIRFFKFPWIPFK